MDFVSMVKMEEKWAQFNKIIIMDLIEECGQQENKGTREQMKDRMRERERERTNKGPRGLNE